MALINDNLRDDEVAVRGADPWLVSQLKSPSVVVEFSDIPDLFEYTVITFLCEPTAPFEAGGWLTAAVRGAWVSALRRLESVLEPPGSIERPNANAVFTGEHLYVGDAHVPRPYVISLSRQGKRIAIHLTLFGWAAIWRDDAMTAMFNAFETGISLRPTKPGQYRPSPRARWALHDCYYQWHPRVCLRSMQSECFLFWDTPLKLGGGATVVTDFGEFLYRLAKRIRLLSRWQGYEISFTPKEVWADAQFVRGKYLEENKVSRYERRTSRSYGRTLHMSGVTSTMNLTNIPNKFWPILEMGQVTLAGSQTSYGFGKYRLA